MCVGVLSLVINDAIAKDLVARYDPFQILFVRSVIALPIIAGFVLWTNGVGGFTVRRIHVHALRALLAAGATYLFIRSLGVLTLAQATSIIFVSPLFVAALSMPLLKQRVGKARRIAVIVGFIGVLIVLQPGSGTLQLASGLALGAALLNALVMMSARWIDSRDGFWTMTLYMALFSSLFSSITLVMEWPPPTATDVALLFGMAITGTLGIALISHAFRIADAAVVAPFDYTALIWATLLGWLVWGHIPSLAVYAGAAVIIASGIYLVVSEKQRAPD